MAMLFNRKTGAPFLVALLAAGLPCTVFAGPQEQQAKVIQAMQQAPLVVKNPPVLGLKVDRADVYQLPRNFRMATDEYKGMTKSGCPLDKAWKNCTLLRPAAFPRKNWRLSWQQCL